MYNVNLHEPEIMVIKMQGVFQPAFVDRNVAFDLPSFEGCSLHLDNNDKY